MPALARSSPSVLVQSDPLDPPRDPPLDLAAIDHEIAPHIAPFALPELAVQAPPAPLAHTALDQAALLRRIVAHPPSPQPEAPVSVAARPQTRAARIIAVASGKGGVGKTTLAVNLAVALAQRGVRAALLDADFGTANADLLCGLSPAARIDHVFAPAGDRWHDAAPARLSDIAIDAPGGFKLIPGASGVSRMADLSPADRAAIVLALNELDAAADVLILDLAAGAGRDVTSFLPAADLTLLVTTPEPTALTDAYALIKCAIAAHGPAAFKPHPQAHPADRLCLIVNQVADTAEALRVHARLHAVCSKFLGLHVPYLGSIAQDPRVPDAVRARSPLLLRSPACPATHNIKDLAHRLHQQLGLDAPRTAPPDAHPERPRRSRLVRLLLGDSRA